MMHDTHTQHPASQPQPTIACAMHHQIPIAEPDTNCCEQLAHDNTQTQSTLINHVLMYLIYPGHKLSHRSIHTTLTIHELSELTGNDSLRM